MKTCNLPVSNIRVGSIVIKTECKRIYCDAELSNYVYLIYVKLYVYKYKVKSHIYYIIQSAYRHD